MTAYQFGTIVISPHAKRVTKNGRVLPVGGRAFDLLLCLVEFPGVVLTRETIVERVWPGLFVSDGNLRVQISQLRKVLDEGTIVNVVGRGYCFTAQVELIELAEPPPVDGIAEGKQFALSGLIGRADEVSTVTELLIANRLVTIVGTGGVGKSALAGAVLRGFANYEVTRVDLSPSNGGHAIVTALVHALGASQGAMIHLDGLDFRYDDVPRLIVFDSCEHLPTVAEVVVEFLRQTERLRILCTSREPVRVADEQLFRLSSLAIPPRDISSANEALQYASVELLLKRGRSVLPEFDINDNNLPSVVSLSRQLDGIPLAIELAVGRLNSLGVEMLASRLGGYQGLVVSSSRSAPARHRTLVATLDWSYGLLSEDEQRALRCLSVFAGEFTMEAAEFLLSASELALGEAADLIINLIDKSLISVNLADTPPRYRLLDTTRAYARDRLLGTSADAVPTFQRHAQYIETVLTQAQQTLRTRPEDDWLTDYSRELDDIRVALDWAFSPNGDPQLGLSITASAPTLWFRMSLVKEARERFRQAIDHLSRSPSGDPERDFEVYAAMGATLNYTIGPGEEAASCWNKAQAIAEHLNRDDFRLRAMWGLWLNTFSAVQMRESLHWAQRIHDLAAKSGDLTDQVTGHRVNAMTLNFMGHVNEAARHLDAVAARGNSRGSELVRVPPIDPELIGDTFRSSVDWLRGFPDRAVLLSQVTVERASRSKHSMSLPLALVDSGCLVTYLAGETEMLADFVDRLRDASRHQAVGPWDGWCRGYEGCLLLLQGRPHDAVASLQEALWKISKARWMIRKCLYVAVLARSFATIGEPGAALHLLDQELATTTETGDLWAYPELLRAKATSLKLQGAPHSDVEALLQKSITFSKDHSLLSWELRSAIDLSELLSTQGETGQALSLLQDVMSRVTEGHSRSDWLRASVIADRLA